MDERDEKLPCLRWRYIVNGRAHDRPLSNYICERGARASLRSPVVPRTFATMREDTCRASVCGSGGLIRVDVEAGNLYPPDVISLVGVT